MVFTTISRNLWPFVELQNRLWMVSVTLILNGFPQKIVQFDFRKQCAKDGLLRWLCGKWLRSVETKCRPCHPFQFFLVDVLASQ